MFRKFKNKKVEMIIYVLILFVFILVVFGGINIYKSCKIINTQANTSFIFMVDGMRKSVNRYFRSAEEETEHCRRMIELTVDEKKIKRIAHISSQYDENNIPYVQNYLNSTLEPILLYSATHIEGLLGIYFNFDHDFLKNKELIGLWYVDVSQDRKLKIIDNGLTSTMYPENRSDLEWFYLPKKLKKGVWSEPYVDDDLKIDMITYSTPVYINKTFLGIMGVDISMEKIRDFLLKLKVQKTGKSYLISGDNKIIFANGYKPSVSTAVIDKNLYEFINKNYVDNIEPSKNKKVRLIKSHNKLYATVKLYNDFILVVEVSKGDLYGEVNKLILFTSFSLILAIIISVLTAIEAYSKVKKINMELMHKEKLISMGTLAAEVAHEINNPLGYVSCNIDTLKMFLQKIKGFMLFCQNEVNMAYDRKSLLEKEFEEIKSFKSELKIEYILNSIDDLIDETKQGIKKVSDIVINLKNFSKKDSQGSKSNEKLAEIVESSLMILNNKIGSNIEVIKHFEIMPNILCNKSELEQVLINMIDNACQALEEKKHSDKRIIVSVYKRGKNACIEIEDNGTGIEKDKMDKIFESFYTTKDYGQGTGLGLSIAYEIVTNKHNGEILVESKSGKGTRFIIKIPYKKYKGEFYGI